MVAQAAILGHQARRVLGRLWNSIILYAQGNKIAKLCEKIGTMYKPLRPPEVVREEVVASANAGAVGSEWVVPTVDTITTPTIRSRDAEQPPKTINIQDGTVRKETR